MNILIITGGSKGIGKAIAKKYKEKNYHVFSMARSLSENTKIFQIKVDLSNTNESTNALHTVFSQINSEIITSITLINNAGTLGTINTIGNLTAKNIAQTLHLNTTTPLVLSNQFIQLTKNWDVKKQIINISSGAATTPYQGWATYCTSKAGLDMMTKVIATEQNEIKNGVKCIALYPGVVDTDMQHQIRKTSKNEFKNVQRFIDLKKNNELYTATFVADKIYEIDKENQLESGAIEDLRNL